jgi:hypothetical protein
MRDNAKEKSGKKRKEDGLNIQWFGESGSAMKRHNSWR